MIALFWELSQNTVEWNACMYRFLCFFPYSFYRWTFNNSAEAKEVEKHFIRTNGTTSLLTFTPTRTLEYGTLMCWSRNGVGEQRDPCIFHIIAAGEQKQRQAKITLSKKSF